VAELYRDGLPWLTVALMKTTLVYLVACGGCAPLTATARSSPKNEPDQLSGVPEREDFVAIIDKLTPCFTLAVTKFTAKLEPLTPSGTNPAFIATVRFEIPQMAPVLLCSTAERIWWAAPKSVRGLDAIPRL